MSHTPRDADWCPDHPGVHLQPNIDAPGLLPWCPKGHYLGTPSVRDDALPTDQIDNFVTEARVSES